MLTFLLVIIYVAFISLGLPDAILGSAWPQIGLEADVPLYLAGLISTIVCIGTTVSSLFSTKVIAKLGTGKTTLISIILTAIGILGCSFGFSVIGFCLFAIPLGIGAGSVDAALNNFVALHYKAKHMSWLHCFWGVGASAGPIVMSFFIAGQAGWQGGYFTIGVFQVLLVIAIAFSLPAWKKIEPSIGTNSSEQQQQYYSNRQALKLPGVAFCMCTFFCYCAVELTAGLWASSYLVNARGLSISTAASWASLFYFGIAFGRFLCGFLTSKLSSKSLIRIGLLIIILGISILFLPLPTIACFFALILIGLGCAPIFPCSLHETPVRFGKAASGAVMGLQMAIAYVGSMLVPPTFGVIANFIGLDFFPIMLMLFTIIMVLTTEATNKLTKSQIAE